ncbi:MAG TPA: DUF6587 family protein [Steroidobacteraceae bacterium]|nr:DUF6587 family protein [Steroidobacteraceae bacterium]
MRHVIDLLLVSLALLASAAYLLFALGPKSLRKSAVAAIADLAARVGVIPGLRGPLHRLSANLANKVQGGCGGCVNCGSDAAAESDAPTPETRVPISKVGLRRQARR